MSALKHSMSNKTPDGTLPRESPQREEEEKQTAVYAFCGSSCCWKMFSADFGCLSTTFLLLDSAAFWEAMSRSPWMITRPHFSQFLPFWVPRISAEALQFCRTNAPLFQWDAGMLNSLWEWVTGPVYVVLAPVQFMLVMGSRCWVSEVSFDWKAPDVRA